MCVCCETGYVRVGISEVKPKTLDEEQMWYQLPLYSATAITCQPDQADFHH